MTGTGTSADPYIVYTWNELLTTVVQDNVYIELGSDIDCKELGAITIGSNQGYAMRFASLDGKECAIRNLYLLNSATLFIAVRKNIIQDLTFDNVYMDYSGSFFEFRSDYPMYYELPSFLRCHFNAELVNKSVFIDPLNTHIYATIFKECTFHILSDDSEFTWTRSLSDDRQPILLDDCVVELYGTYRGSCLSAQLVNSKVMGEVTMLTADDDYLRPVVKIENVGSYQVYSSDDMKANSIVDLIVWNDTGHNLHVYIYGSYYYVGDDMHYCTESLFINTAMIDDIELHQDTQCKPCTASQITDVAYLRNNGFITGTVWNENLVHHREDEVIRLGAFCNDTSLSVVSIPRSVKKIGRFAFKNTNLTNVTIARDCEYYPTSFPDGCAINFYSD